MNISRIDASDRFDNVKFDNVFLDGMARSINTFYTCPQCGEQVGFQIRNFENAKRQRHTNLSPEVAEHFEEFVRSSPIGTRDWLDWLCPGCGVSVRVFFESWGGGRHGDGGIDLLTLLELVPQLAHSSDLRL